VHQTPGKAQFPDCPINYAMTGPANCNISPKTLMNKGPRILIIDDEKELCELIQLILKDENYKIDCAYTLKEGKKKWISLLPPIVLLDYNLPDGSGLDLIEQNPSLLFTSKVILISGDGHELTKIRAEAAGIEFFIQKPFSLKLIRELVHEIILVHNN
jgi:DNA-binding response OmpR family regulator